MPLLNDVRLGRVLPTLGVLPPGSRRNPLADDALDVAAVAGLDLYEWQANTLVDSMALAADGRWAAREVGVIVGRQNGKGSILEVRQLAGLFVLNERLQVHSAHEFKTCYEHFRRVKDLINGCDLLREQVEIIRTGAGDQAIELKSGARIRFIARNGSSGRGFSADTVYLDEAFKLDETTIGALIPALSARPNPQIWYTSSAPHSDSPVLHRVRARAIAGDDPRLMLAEWGNDADTSPTDPEAWANANPSMGLRIQEDDIAAEQRTLSPDEFARERLGIPEPAPDEFTESPIDLAKWSTLTDADSLPTPGSERIALDAPQDRTSAVFAVAGKRSDGLAHVSVRLRVEKAGGLLRDQVIAQALLLQAEHKTPIILPPSSPAKAWRTELLAAGVELDELTGAVFAEACGAMSSLVDDGAIRHRGQADMTEAVAGLAVKPSGDVDVWSARKSSVNIAPFRAATCALVRVAKVAEPSWLFQ